MDGRIGSLEVRYQTRGLDPHLAARLPALTRAFEAQLADVLDADLTAAIGAGRDVYVVRELNVHTTLEAGWMLDRPVVERMSRASVEAVSAALARPSDDVKHFADQAEFLCAFIVDELEGTAVNQWYFGAFASCRRPDAAATIAAVLASHPGQVAATLGRLARRGRLDAVLSALGPRRVLAALDAASAVPPAADVGVLVDAALHLVTLAGWAVGAGERQTIRRALLARHADAAPPWHDRRILSAFVWVCVEDAAEMLRAQGVERADGDRSAVVRALHGDLEWLDAPWLLERMDAAGVRANDGGTPAPPNRLAIVLTRIAAAVADGCVSLRGSDDDTLVVRLVAAAQLSTEERVSVDALRAALGGAVREWRAHDFGLASDQDIDHARTVARPPDARAPADHRGPAGALTPEAAVTALTRALAEHAAATASEGQPTLGAGLYLLSRAVLDAGLPGLAAAHGVALSPLLAQLATRWLSLEWPLDEPAHEWTGAGSRDETALERLGPSDGLTSLASALRDRLLAQGALTGAGDNAAGEPVPGTNTAAILDDIAAWLLRAWARWLPGLHGASSGFLRAQCLARGGAVRRTATRLDVTLDPAPLDVVLQMAGYLRPIASLPWCGNRAVSFVVRRQPSA